MGDDTLEVRPHEPFITLLKCGVQIEDGLARAVDEAERFAMRDRHVGADEVMGELDAHPNAAEPSALEKRRPHLRVRIGLCLGHLVCHRGKRRSHAVHSWYYHDAYTQDS